MGKYSAVWPIDAGAGVPPVDWPGWPEKKRFALVLTHDVEDLQGLLKVPRLVEMEERLGFRSSYNFVPEKYKVSPDLRKDLEAKGFEVGVHGLKHDGKYFNSMEIFADRARRINRYLKEWNAVGFRMPAMHHKLEWFHDLHIEYDASTFDTDPFEPFPDGVRRIFPFMVSDGNNGKGYVELPYTLPQDFLVFILLRERHLETWKRKIEWVVGKGGMVLFIAHPDYMNFGETKMRTEEYPAEYYGTFLEYVRDTYRGEYWNALPREISAYIRAIDIRN
jgi:hypothetical protein